MRSFLARFALAGTFGIAFAGCGTQNGTSLPVGAFPNAAGGGPAQISNQAPANGTVSGKTLIGGFTPATAFTGYNVVATDALSPLDYGNDTAVADSGAPPAAPGSSHLITFTGNRTPVVTFRYTGTIGSLTIPVVTTGQILPQTYGAVILHATSPLPRLGTFAPTSLFIELVGGTGATAYDVRSTCTAGAAAAINGLRRYVCLLPAYGTPSTPGLQNPVLSGATGTFTPSTPPVFYVGETYGTNATDPAATSTLNIDYVYAEQGVL